MFGEFTHKKLDLDGKMGYNLRMKPTKDPCEECLIAHYCQENFGKSGCPRARAALSDKAKLEGLIVAFAANEVYRGTMDYVQKAADDLYAAVARITRRKAAARLARQGKP